MAYKHTATSDGVYEQLKEQILHLELPPGSTISEIDTAEKYNISRTPVRDAFKRLEREGLLEIRPHIGTFISLIDLYAVSDVLYTREVLEYAVLQALNERNKNNDIFEGPGSSKKFKSFGPVIADLYATDMEYVERKKREIPEELWQRTTELGKEYMVKNPGMARNGLDTCFKNAKKISEIKFNQKIKLD